MPLYTEYQIISMNASYPWNGTLSIPHDVESKKGLYNNYATGDADLNGRKYVALPAEMKLTPEIKKKYNLM